LASGVYSEISKKRVKQLKFNAVDKNIILVKISKFQ